MGVKHALDFRLESELMSQSCFFLNLIILSFEVLVSFVVFFLILFYF